MNKKGEINVGTCLLIGIVVMLVIIGIMSYSSYNTLQKSKLEVDKKYSYIEVYIDRRSALIPKLVETVQAQMKHEKNIYQEISDARAELGKAMETGEFEKVQEASDNLSLSLNRLISIAEDNPQLGSNNGFSDLRDQIEGAENRISNSKREYVNAVFDYNTHVTTLPATIFAKVFGFQELPNYKATDKAHQDVDLKFDP